MHTVVGSTAPSGDVPSGTHTAELSLVRLYALRAAYLLLAVGLGRFVWPTVIHLANELATTEGVRFGLLAGLGLTAALGLHPPHPLG